MPRLDSEEGTAKVRARMPMLLAWEIPIFSSDGTADGYLRLLWMSQRRWNRSRSCKSGLYKTLPIGPFIVAARIVDF